MSLGVTRPLFTQKWVDGLRASAESAMVAEVSIYTVVGEPQYDPDTDSWTAETTTYYSGKARVQPIRSVLTAEAPGNTSTVQGVRIQIPISAFADDFRPGMQVAVTSSPLNATLTEFEYHLSGVVDSSNPFERTLEAKVNQETVRSPYVVTPDDPEEPEEPVDPEEPGDGDG